MAIALGDPSASRLRVVVAANVRVMSITSPKAGIIEGSPICLSYLLESDSDHLATNLNAQYSLDSGTTYAACTAITGHRLHDDTSSLTASNNGTEHVFVWDAEEDLGVGYTGSGVLVRIRAYDGSTWSDYTTSSAFDVNMVPNVTIVG